MLEVKLDDRDAKAEQLEAELHSTELSLQEREQKIENLGQELETLNEGLELAQAELKGVARLPKVNVNMRGADEEAVCWPPSTSTRRDGDFAVLVLQF